MQRLKLKAQQKKAEAGRMLKEIKACESRLPGRLENPRKKRKKEEGKTKERVGDRKKKKSKKRTERVKGVCLKEGRTPY